MPIGHYDKWGGGGGELWFSSPDWGTLVFLLWAGTEADICYMLALVPALGFLSLRCRGTIDSETLILATDLALIFDF